MNDSLNAVEFSTGNSTPAHSVIWLHGLGADGNDFAPVVPELEKAGVSPVRFIFPHAPERPVTINAGMRMRAWYDITSLDFDSRDQDAQGTASSQALVIDLIRRENTRGIETQNIVIAGFSQGGAIALYTGLRYEETLAGVMALSTYLPFADQLEAEKSAQNAKTSLFMAHGEQDDVIALRYATNSRDRLFEQGYSVDWHTYKMPHTLSVEEIADIAIWLKAVFNIG